MLLTKKEIYTLKELVPEIEQLVKNSENCPQSTFPALLEASYTVGVPFDYEIRLRELASDNKIDGKNLRKVAEQMLDAVNENIALSEEGKLIVV